MRVPKIKSPTRLDVARRAHTSAATVSYVVNNGPKFVSEATRDRVLRAIEELGYRPDPVALSLRGGATNAVGMLVPNLAGPFFADLIAEVEAQAKTRGKIVLFGSTQFDPESERELLQSFRDWRLDAVLIIGPTEQIDADNVEHGAVNVLRIGLGERRAIPIGIRQSTATRAAARHLIEHGRRRIAAIFGPANHGVFNARYRGWRAETHYSAERTRELVRRADYSFRGGFDATIDLFSQDQPPDALFVSNDTQAIGALSALDRLGLSVPKDVAITSIDGTRLSPYLVPSLTSVRQPTDLIATAALDVIDANSAEAPNSIRVPFDLEIHRSCGCEETQP